MAWGAEDSEIRNRFLLALPATVADAIKRHCEPVDLTPRQIVYQAGARIEYLYFINRGLVSLVKTMQDGRSVEVGAVGIEGIVGVSALRGINQAVWESIVLEPGTAFRFKVSIVEAELSRSETFRELLHKYIFIKVNGLAQTSACNRLHSLEERFCRWLLAAHDNAGSDIFPLTHEALALMLGVQRSGLSITANLIQKAGIIKYTRGRITVTDRPKLEAASCECYHTMQTQYDQLFVPKKMQLQEFDERGSYPTGYV